jgi:energy coupling factor transporter S component ThiW
MKTRKLTTLAVLMALGVVMGQVFYIPLGVALIFPMQHLINVVAAVLLGPAGAVANAFGISVIRNLLGTGSLLAFPGSMIGAFLAGILYQRFERIGLAVVGEAFGTGILGALIAVPFAQILMGKTFGTFALVVPFLSSSAAGAIMGGLILSLAAFKNLLISWKQ